MGFIALDKLINLHDGYRRRIKIDALDVLLIQEQGQITVFENRCPHQGFPLHAGEIEDGILFCPRHHFGFSLETGEQVDRFCPSLIRYNPVFEGSLVGVVIS